MTQRARLLFFVLLSFACGLLVALLVVGAQVAFGDEPTIVYLDENPVACRHASTPPNELPVCP